MFSFFNAGSGANQSNHNYKLGAVHQGVLARGSKLGSSSYLLLPAAIGEFSILAGQHKNHPDTADFPFSYIVDRQGESYILPAKNLVNSGVFRDSEKWKNRDRRSDAQHLDIVNLNLFNPLVMKKIRRALALLATLQENDKKEIYHHGNCKIDHRSLRQGISLYAMAIDQYFGNALKTRLQGVDLENSASIRQRLKPAGSGGAGEWRDLAGLLAPESEIEKLLAKIVEKHLTLSQINDGFEQMHRNYDNYLWDWTLENWLNIIEKPIETVTDTDVKLLFDLHKIQNEKYRQLLEADVEKEFSETAKISYGIDRKSKAADFKNVRGDGSNINFKI
jgi:hypothetical protein